MKNLRQPFRIFDPPRYENRFLQVKRQGRHYAPAKAKVVVCEWEDGRLEIHYRGQKVAWEEIAERAQAAEAEPTHKMTKSYGGTPPTANHPWKQRYAGMKASKALGPGLKEAEIALVPPLRSALNARSSASQKQSKGDASKTMGTFLTRVDKRMKERPQRNPLAV